MVTPENLENYNAEVVSFGKGDVIFRKGVAAKYYFQIISGGVKMNYFNANGNEFIQGIFGKDKSFGEPPLFIDSEYPANAVAMSNVVLYRLLKADFMRMLSENERIHFNFTKNICRRLYFKATVANGITSNSAEEAILTLFNYLKNDVYENNIPFGLKIDLTRKNIAGMLGLSVEATIRTIKKMELQNRLKIIEQKIYF